MAYKKLKLWFDESLAELLAGKIIEHDPEFESQLFCNEIKTGVIPLELKDRVELIADKLHQFLRNDFISNVRILEKILGPPNDEETGMFTNFYWIMPLAKYVEKYGLDDFDISMNFVKQITMRNTSEYAIRPYVIHHYEKTMKQMSQWSLDSNFHVRRLSCEGLRPRLPWAKKLQIFIDNPAPLIPILNNLKADKSKYVQNSVANCINDIIKDNLEVATKLIESWLPTHSNETKWIIKHSLRKLKKEKNNWALEIINSFS